jgi:hypothetical protein
MARLSAALVLLGALAGTLAGAGLAPRPPARHGAFLVLAADFHVHGFPGDGALPAWALRNEARRRSLDVIAFTNHNHRLGVVVGRWIARDTAVPLVLRAEEMTAPHYHIAAIGIEHTVPGTLRAIDAIAAVHAQGGVAIAAHPARLFWTGWDDAAKHALDGAEIAHPMTVGDPRSRAELIEFSRGARELNPRLAPIGSTDYHFRQPMGLCRTYVFAREYSEAGVLEAVRAGRTAAFDADGRAYGAPDLVAAAQRVRADIVHPARWRIVADRLSGLLAMIGIAGLIAIRIPNP